MADPELYRSIDPSSPAETQTLYKVFAQVCSAFLDAAYIPSSFEDKRLRIVKESLWFSPGQDHQIQIDPQECAHIFSLLLDWNTGINTPDCRQLRPSTLWRKMADWVVAQAIRDRPLEALLRVEAIAVFSRSHLNSTGQDLKGTLLWLDRELPKLRRKNIDWFVRFLGNALLSEIQTRGMAWISPEIPIPMNPSKKRAWAKLDPEGGREKLVFWCWFSRHVLIGATWRTSRGEKRNVLADVVWGDSWIQLENLLSDEQLTVLLGEDHNAARRISPKGPYESREAYELLFEPSEDGYSGEFRDLPADPEWYEWMLEDKTHCPCWDDGPTWDTYWACNTVFGVLCPLFDIEGFNGAKHLESYQRDFENLLS